MAAPWLRKGKHTTHYTFFQPTLPIFLNLQDYITPFIFFFHPLTQYPLPKNTTYSPNNIYIRRRPYYYIYHWNHLLGTGSALSFPLLDEEKAEQGDHRESREDAGGDVDGGMAAGDGLYLEEVSRLVGVGALPVPDLVVARVECIGSDKVGGAGDVPLHRPPEALGRAAGRIRPRYDLELACLVLAQVVLGLPPRPVALAHRRIAQLHLHRPVHGVAPGRNALV